MKLPLFKDILKEVLGVPEGNVQSALKLYSELVQFLTEKENENYQYIDIVNEPFEFGRLGSGYQIGDLNISQIDVTFQYSDYPSLVFMGMGVQSKKKYIDKKFSFPKDEQFSPEMNIYLDIGMPTYHTPISQILDFFKKEKQLIVGSFAHEMKHFYDEYKDKSGYKAIDRTKYDAALQLGFGPIKPINDLLYKIYFITNIESLVRPSEFAAEIETSGVTKEEFYEFLVKSKLFGKLKEIRDWTYEGFREDLKNYVPQIKEAFDEIGQDYDSDTSDDEIIDIILEIFVMAMYQTQSSRLYDFVKTQYGKSDLFSQFLIFNGIQEPLSDEGKKQFEDQLKIINRFGNNFESYLKHEQKFFNMNADKVIKKIAKLYALAPDSKEVTEHIVINPDTWYSKFDIRNLSPLS
jgi:hypothetical protein